MHTPIPASCAAPPKALPVWDWLKTLHINPMHRVLQPHEAEAAVMAVLCRVGAWRHHDRGRHVAVHGRQRQGGRGGRQPAGAVPYVDEHPEYNYFDTLEKNEAMIEGGNRKAGGRINVCRTGAPVYADEAGQRRAIELARSTNRLPHPLQRG